MPRADRFVLDIREIVFFAGNTRELSDIALTDGQVINLPKLRLMEGRNVRIRLATELRAFYPLLNWSQLNITAGTAVIQYYNPDTSAWVTLSAGDEFDEVASGEVTLTTTYLVSDGFINIGLAQSSITEDKIDQFRLNISLTQ